MTPIRELLNRIRRDLQFADAAFRIGYYDRVDGTIIVVPLSRVVQEPGDSFAVRVLDHAGVMQSGAVPPHQGSLSQRRTDLATRTAGRCRSTFPIHIWARPGVFTVQSLFLPGRLDQPGKTVRKKVETNGEPPA